MKANRPNIILINCDDLGYGDLGCYGSLLNRTPHIDALAANGLRLTDFYMASPVCSASRAAMMTGCYPPRVGFGERPVLFPGDPLGLNPAEKTMAGYLNDAGYATKLVGKWHCGDQPEFLPTRHGFDEYYGLPYSNDMGRQANRPDSPPLPLIRNESVIEQQPDQRTITSRYTEECLRFIDDHRDAPFFLYLAHMYVHVPLFVPQPFLERSRNGAYGAAVECIDWSTGVIVDRLRQHGLLENTLLIFTSDNGSRAGGEGGSNGSCCGGKATTWEGGQRVPCIMHWPAAIEAGRFSGEITSSLDFLPTLCSLAGTQTEPMRHIDGGDLSAFIRGETENSGRNEFYYYSGSALEAVRTGHWKLHVHKGSVADGVWKRGDPAPMLFNLHEDLSETRERQEQYPEIVADLMERIETMRVRLGDCITGSLGKEVRPAGRVHCARTLTEYRTDHPYMIAMYDLPDMPVLSG